MDVRIILSRVDHTLLQPASTLTEVQQACSETLQYRMASVIIPPNYVGRIRKKFGSSLNIGTVVGYPLGFTPSSIKQEETRLAVFDGADEIDLCINQCDLKNQDYDLIRREIADIRKACRGHTLKVIVETGAMLPEEKIRMCQIVSHSGAEYIKAVHSFTTDDTCLEDVGLFRKYLSNDVRISAAGGILTLADIQSYIACGCDRVATPNAVDIMKDLGVF